jgi:hypothetical protein
MMGATARALLAADRALAGRAAAALQLLGAAIAALLALLWALSARARRRELRRRRFLTKTRAAAAAAGAPPPPPPLPAVAAVLPARERRAHSEANWRAALALEYPGPLELLFVVGERSDPAAAGIETLLAERAAAPRATGAPPPRAARLLAAGRAERSSQKIHNLLAGAAAAAPPPGGGGALHKNAAAKPAATKPPPAYVLFLDDDVRPHAAALADAVAALEADPSLRLASGYPFDLPPPNASFLAYAVLAYHLPLVIPFSLSERVDFVWGGFLLLRGADVAADALGLLAAWREGGYSDDLAAAARATELGLKVAVPRSAVFAQWVEPPPSARAYWNYLRRQLAVLDTYHNAHARRANWALAALHAAASWGFALPALALGARAALRVVAAALVLVLESPAGGLGGGVAAAAAVLVSGDGAGSSALEAAASAAFAAAWAAAVAALAAMAAAVVALLAELDPPPPPPAPRRAPPAFHWSRLWAAFVGANALLPLCLAYTFATRHVVWAGIRYERRRGRVVKVLHPRAAAG